MADRRVIFTNSFGCTSRGGSTNGPPLFIILDARITGIFQRKIHRSEVTTVVSKKVLIFAGNELKDKPYALPDWNTEL